MSAICLSGSWKPDAHHRFGIVRLAVARLTEGCRCWLDGFAAIREDVEARRPLQKNAQRRAAQMGAERCVQALFRPCLQPSRGAFRVATLSALFQERGRVLGADLFGQGACDELVERDALLSCPVLCRCLERSRQIQRDSRLQGQEILNACTGYRAVLRVQAVCCI